MEGTSDPIPWHDDRNDLWWGRSGKKWGRRLPAALFLLACAAFGYLEVTIFQRVL
jgi:hypothetical protein